MVKAADTTTVAKIIMYGQDRNESEVWLNSAPFADVAFSNLSLAYQPQGPRFPHHLTQVQPLTGIARLSRSSGAYAADERGFVIDRDPAYMPCFEKDCLRHRLLDTAEVPEAFRQPFVRIGCGAPLAYEIARTHNGFVLILDGDPHVILPASAAVFPISHPVAAARNGAGTRSFGITYGAEGFLYAFSREESQWSAFSSMGGAVASGMIHDCENARLVIVISGLVGADEPALPCVPVAIAGDRLLLVIAPPHFGQATRRTGQVQPI